ncbi:MAG: UvrD-helicase domain-containing protein, partial [bacterium]
MPNYNDAQVAAIAARVPLVLVSAGAGSGKTRVLTERYFRLLEGDKLTTEQILTLTFTRKAAQEMRERIAQRLEADGRIAERRKLPRAPIGTLHSFCERLLREHAMRAGVDPNFTLLDDAEAQTLQEEALDQVFNDLWESDDEQEKLLLGRLLLDYRQDDLRGGLLQVYRNARTRGLAIADITADSTDSPARAAVNVRQSIEDYLKLTGTATFEAKKGEMTVALQSLEPLFTMPDADINWD